MEKQHQLIMEELSQLAIITFSGSTIFLLSSNNNKIREMGFICGLLGQPFWTYTTIHNQQWGIFILSIWHTLNFLRGLWLLRKNEFKKHLKTINQRFR